MNARIVVAARALAGTCFRLHGRSREHGVDCVGLIELAVRGAGIEVKAPGGYALRTGDADRVAAMIAAAGAARTSAPGPGCVLLMRVAPTQLHLGIATGDGVIHADAHLRRVVERPGEAPWPVIAAFSFQLGDIAWRH